MATKNCELFYVKTYGGSHSINGVSEKNRYGQKWMVYWKKYHVKTFPTAKAAKAYAEECNNAPDREERILRLKQKRMEKLGEVKNSVSIDAVELHLTDLRNELAEIGNKVDALSKLVKCIKEREG